MEDEETPEQAALVALPGEMLADKECYGLRAEDSCCSDAVGSQCVQ
jgi:hypothetical protein